MMKKFLVSFLVVLLLASCAHAATKDYPDIQVTTLKYEPTPAEPGSYVDLWVKVQNSGDREADDVKITLDPKFPFSLDSTEAATKTIGTLGGSEYSTQKYHIRVDENAIQGSNDIDVLYSYGTVAGEVTLEVDVRTHYAELGVEKVVSDPERIPPGSS